MIINWGLLKHPLNWLIVVLMVLIAGAGAHFIKEFVTTNNGGA